MTDKAINVTVNSSALGTVTESEFTPLFQHKLQSAFPNVNINIQYGTRTTVEFHNIYDAYVMCFEETVHEIGVEAFKEATERKTK